jgi:hypothetical protein
MTRYIVLYRAPIEVAERFARATAEEAQQGLHQWIDWAAKLGPALIDPGQPLANAHDVTSAGVIASDTDVIGTSIIVADSMEEALSFVKDHHHLHWADACSITVLEEMAIPELAGSTE